VRLAPYLIPFKVSGAFHLTRFYFSGQGIRKLIKTNFVLKKPPTVHSRSRVRRRDLAKRKVHSHPLGANL
jgi:ribosomal protein L19E